MKRLMCLMCAFLMIFVFCLPTKATNVYKSNENAGKKVALTFDDGPHPIYTLRILDILEKYGVKATFFVIGRNVENYPEAFDAIAMSENEIGNHTYNHENVGNMSEARIKSEIAMTEKAIESRCNRHTFLFRPPEGNFGDRLKRLSAEGGYDIILWSIDTLDWAHTPTHKMMETVFTKLGNGDIILMHDYTSHGAHTCEVLELMIPKMLEMGYEFVTVSELICEE